MNTFFTKLKAIIGDASLRNRILMALGIIAIFRFLSAIPVPGVNQEALTQYLGNSEFLGFLNIFAGGGLSILSIVMLGVGPYITASIIMQLATVLSPRLKSMATEEGDFGRKKIAQYSRLLTIPLAFIQGFSFIVLLQKEGIISVLSQFDMLVTLFVIVAGSMLLMWLGEVMTEFGIGNGVSMIIFAGIVSSLPGAISTLRLNYDPSMVTTYLLFLLVGILTIYFVVYITEAERSIPVTYAKQMRGNKMYGGSSSYLPLRLNQSGVMPIIFALSILVFPRMLLSVLTYTQWPWVAPAATFINGILANQFFYGLFYFLLVFLFTFFYTAVTFDPHAISENLQKSGAFIPGVRPGESTTTYLGKVVTRITLVGALFLGLIAVLPVVVQASTGIQNITLGGTSLLIVVSVVLEMVKKFEGQLAMREY
jgi:preprotein translocase subunit SecY